VSAGGDAGAETRIEGGAAGGGIGGVGVLRGGGGDGEAAKPDCCRDLLVRAGGRCATATGNDGDDEGWPSGVAAEEREGVTSSRPASLGSWTCASGDDVETGGRCEGAGDGWATGGADRAVADGNKAGRALADHIAAAQLNPGRLPVGARALGCSQYRQGVSPLLLQSFKAQSYHATTPTKDRAKSNKGQIDRIITRAKWGGNKYCYHPSTAPRTRWTPQPPHTATSSSSSPNLRPTTFVPSEPFRQARLIPRGPARVDDPAAPPVHRAFKPLCIVPPAVPVAAPLAQLPTSARFAVL
jgi:hypothetical protein